jgi:Selenoprotein, putative
VGGVPHAGRNQGAPVTAPVRDALRGVHRFLKEVTGEAKWDDYLEECAAAGTTPVSRRSFEQRRAHQKECRSGARCC